MHSSHEAVRRPDGRPVRALARARAAVGLVAAVLLSAAASAVVVHAMTEYRHGDGPAGVHVFAGGPEDWNNTVSQPPPRS
ncbi:hypothetical protein ACF1GT_21170 [Streptomyces sp. NPDC014636]|uniref:hypothetical protein n=1 Tax=Streptomyces sp. NPDC014636 TaxID=3364876 RepID=UPI0036F57435